MICDYCKKEIPQDSYYLETSKKRTKPKNYHINCYGFVVKEKETRAKFRER